MSPLDYWVLFGTIAAIAAYGSWTTRGRRTLSTYLRGDQSTGWIVIGISVMATQASAITFISTPGQGFEDGLGFVQNYFGMPLALVIIAAIFLPIYRRLNVYTAYEFLGKRFDAKTRLLGAALFLLQRGLGAGFTIYAPAIILSTVLGWRLDLTILISGIVVTIYTALGGSEAVNVTQKYQLAVIFGGMVAAFVVVVLKLTQNLSFADALTVAGGFNKLQGVDFSININRRYTFWSGLLGGIFLMLSYFGTDQSQVQRYLGGSSLRESRLGLMFNAVCKIPMQFLILLLGVLVFVFYQFQPAPVFFNAAEWRAAIQTDVGQKLNSLESEFAALHQQKERLVNLWLESKHAGDASAEAAARTEAQAIQKQSQEVRKQVKETLTAANSRAKVNDSDYVFITFILQELPHGLIGLLIAAFFAAALSSKAAELNALASTSVVDFYRHLLRREASDAHYVAASKCFTVFWGLFAISFALLANLAENLIQATNIVASLFYGVVLAMFLVAFFLRWIGGTAVFWGALTAQGLVLFLYSILHISYLWYNLIGCAACVLLSLLLQGTIGQSRGLAEALPTP
jgi:solute:Na+ symporter, SSS family